MALDWFKAYRGISFNRQWLAISHKLKVPVPTVVAVYLSILEYAALDGEGSITDLPVAGIDLFLRVRVGTTQKVIEEFRAAELIIGDLVVDAVADEREGADSTFQQQKPNRKTSTARVRKFRAAQKAKELAEKQGKQGKQEVTNETPNETGEETHKEMPNETHETRFMERKETQETGFTKRDETHETGIYNTRLDNTRLDLTPLTPQGGETQETRFNETAENSVSQETHGNAVTSDSVTGTPSQPAFSPQPEPTAATPQPEAQPEQPTLSPEQPAKPKRKKGRKDRRDELPVRPQDFDRWYSLFPRKDARQEAVCAWNDADEAGVLPEIAVLEKALEWQIPVNDWNPRTRRNYIPLPATYLNARRWQDEPPNFASQSFQQGQSYRPQYSTNNGGMDKFEAQRLCGQQIIEEMVKQGLVTDSPKEDHSNAIEAELVSPFQLPQAHMQGA